MENKNFKNKPKLESKFEKQGIFNISEPDTRNFFSVMKQEFICPAWRRVDSSFFEISKS